MCVCVCVDYALVSLNVVDRGSMSLMTPSSPSPYPPKTRTGQVLELAVFLAVRQKDKAAFQRQVAQLKPYYQDAGCVLIFLNVGLMFVCGACSGRRRHGATLSLSSHPTPQPHIHPTRPHNPQQAAAARVAAAAPHPGPQPPVPAGGEPPRRVPLRGW